MSSEISVSSVGKRFRQRQLPSKDLTHVTELVLADLVRSSRFFDDNPSRPMAHFEPHEIKTGSVLGYGEFGVVHEVLCLDLGEGTSPKETNHALLSPSSHSTPFALPQSIPPHSIVLVNAGLSRGDEAESTQLENTERISGRLQNPETEHASEHEEIDKEYADSVSEVDVDDDLSLCSHHYRNSDKDSLRSTMSKHALREGQARYAVKQLRETLKMGSKERFDASLDLACEAKFLSSIKHSNIIRLRGVVGNPGTVDYALVLDRLVCTLEQRIGEWKHQQDKYSGFLGLRRKANALQQLLVDRLLAVYDIARAMRHLHHNRILYRDLKPDNVGFDVRGNVRLFDFGLAKELKLRDLVHPPDSYDCTGLTGSRRYMSPECARCALYGFSADVYSFGVLSWEICALQTPFAQYDNSKHFENVIVKGKRPPRLKNMTLYPLLSKAWADDPSSRPSFIEICSQLQADIKEQIHDVSCLSIDDRTNFLAERSVASMNED